MMTCHYQFLDGLSVQRSRPSSITRRGSEAPRRVRSTTTTVQHVDLVLEYIARPSAAFRLAHWTAHTPPASISRDRGDIPAATVSRGAAGSRTIGCGLR